MGVPSDDRLFEGGCRGRWLPAEGGLVEDQTEDGVLHGDVILSVVVDLHLIDRVPNDPRHVHKFSPFFHRDPFLFSVAVV